MKPRRTRFLLLLIFFLNIADTVFTWISVSAGMAYEIHPMAEKLISWSCPGFFCIKIGVITLALLFAYKRIKVDSPRYVYTFAVVAAAMLFIVALGFTATLMVFL